MEVTGLEPVTPCLQITRKTLILLSFNNLHPAQSGITRKKPATAATYTQPEQSYGDGTVRALLGWFSYIHICMREEPLSQQLLSLKKKTSWSWERLCYEFHRVMGHEGPTHTTLFRYASGRVKRPHVVVERYVREAIEKVTAELNQKKKRKRQA